MAENVLIALWPAEFLRGSSYKVDYEDVILTSMANHTKTTIQKKNIRYIQERF
ncbi:hypothetical protein SEA_NICEHOUSE_27 [Rhodococcus phage NiceHouse]|nr:hypothetical protein SEA_NICEHOUSE_27 [Rhodococcus phage NiceHouse]